MTRAKMERLVMIGSDRALLDRIARPEAALAIWWRRLPGTLDAALGKVNLHSVSNLSVEVDLHQSVLAPLRSAGYPEPSASTLALDIDLLVHRHAALTGEDRLCVELTVADGEMSSCFRTDGGSLRLHCTYLGPGAQWCCVDGQDAICEVPTGSVAVFKGRSLLYPPAVLHRPPPCDMPRLVLVVDSARSRHGG